jgi:PAS domain S-box-containing protein
MKDTATTGATESARPPEFVPPLAGEPNIELDGATLSITGADLPTSAARFFALSLDLFVTAGPDGYIKHVNPAWKEAMGWTPAELRSRPYVEFIHPDDRQRTVDEAASLAAGGPETRDFELRFLAKDGLFHWLLFSAQAEPDSGLLYATAKDITDRKRAEDALREAEERFRSAFENAAIGMSMTSTDGRFLRVNEALCEITGYAEKDLVGKSVLELTHPDDVDADHAALRSLRAGETVRYRTEKRYMRPDGTPVWVSLSSSVVRGNGGVPLYYISQMEDIDARKRIETELQEALQHFHTVTRSVSDAIVSCDEQSRIVFWNEGAKAIFGYEADEVMGKPLTKLMPERYRKPHLEGIARLRDGGDPRLIGRTVCLEGLRKDGSEFPLELSLGDWHGGGRHQYTGVVRDITERRRRSVADAAVGQSI